MTLKRTFINRGKRPFSPEELKANGTYAVRYFLPVEEAEQRGQQQEQWGIVVLNSSCNIRMSWNLEVKEGWHMGLSSAEGLQFYRASHMEMQFADYFERHYSLKAKVNSMAGMIRTRDIQLDWYHRSRLHTIADRIITFFS